MPAPSSGQLSTWAAAVNTMGPWCPSNLRAGCYTLAATIAAATAPSDATMLGWANQIWNMAATFSAQQWSYANTTAVALVVQAGGETTAIDFTAVLVASGMAPNQARAVANFFVDVSVSGFAALNSPAFTGLPTAPTPPPGDNSTRLATTAFVFAALAALVNSSPALLNTLKELADALNDDPNFATNILAALALKAPLNSPALTGTPTVNGNPLVYDQAGTAVAMAVAFG